MAPSLPVPVLLGHDVYDIQQGWKTPETGLLVETRSQKRRKEEELPKNMIPEPGEEAEADPADDVPSEETSKSSRQMGSEPRREESPGLEVEG